MKNKTLTVYCQHGDERFGALVANQLLISGEKTLLANPVAFIKGVRFLDSDLNRSYGETGTRGYEQKRAMQILEQAAKYDTVIDIHSSRAKVGKVAILASDDPAVLKKVVSLGFHKAVVMPRSIVKTSLIGNVAHGISLEFGANIEQNELTAKELSSKIGAVTNNQSCRGKLDIYYVSGKLASKYRGTGLRNYRYSSNIGGYPILVGESRYKTYAGFFARKTKTISIDSSGKHE